MKIQEAKWGTPKKYLKKVNNMNRNTFKISTFGHINFKITLFSVKYTGVSLSGWGFGPIISTKTILIIRPEWPNNEHSPVLFIGPFNGPIIFEAK